VQNYQFGDISRGVLNLFQKAGETVADGVKSAEFGMESVAAARLELLEQEKIMITKVAYGGCMYTGRWVEGCGLGVWVCFGVWECV